MDKIYGEGAAMPDIDTEIKTAKDKAAGKLEEHVMLAEELAAIQKELERRVSLAKTPKGKKPWNSPGSP